MKPFLLSLAVLSLAVSAWQFAPSIGGAPRYSSDAAVTPIDFASLHAQARGAMERLRDQQTTRLSMYERGARPGYSLQ